MSDGRDAARRAWVARVLGVDLGGGAAGAGGSRWAEAAASWRDASDAVDAQVGALQKALRASGDDALKEIAEFGLNGVTGGFKVPLMAAMRDIDASGVTPAASARIAPIIASFRAHLDGDERVMVCDDNPFGVAVSIRATLGSGLAAIQQALDGTPA